jgi:hypothetical protein
MGISNNLNDETQTAGYDCLKNQNTFGTFLMMPEKVAIE